MTDCMNAEIRDALPDLINGRLSPLDHATLTAHVESCAACTAESALLLEIRRAAPLAPAMDIDRIVAALPLPSAQHSLLALANSETARKGAPVTSASIGFQRKRPVWGIMASVAVIAAAGLSVVMGNGGDAKGAPSARTVAQAPAGDARPVTASAGQPAPVVPRTVDADSAGSMVAITSGRPAGTQSIANSTSDASMTLIPGVSELSDSDLELLLSEMDDMEGIPAQEPDPVTLELGNLEGEG